MIVKKWKDLLEICDPPDSKYLKKSSIEILKFFKTFFSKVTISLNKQEYKIKVHNKGNKLPKSAKVTEDELESLWLLLEDKGCFSFFTRF